jgi:hypothetical protein
MEEWRGSKNSDVEAHCVAQRHGMLGQEYPNSFCGITADNYAKPHREAQHVPEM